MEQLQKLIDEYVKWTQENRMAGKKIAVYLGLQVEQSPKHAAFYEAVGEWAKTFTSSQPEHEQTVAAVRLPRASYSALLVLPLTRRLLGAEMEMAFQTATPL